MSDVKRLVLSIVQFLRQQLQTEELTADAKESVEVAVQCLETAYGVSVDTQSHLLEQRTLLEMFREVSLHDAAQAHTVLEPSPAQQAEAEMYKQEGNNMMKEEQYPAALEYYTKAISLDGHNAVYFCNRAAAYSKLNNHMEAIKDCQRALKIDPKYGKAYGRIGLAYASLNEHQKAKESYQKAVELDPDNQSYINNLRVAEEKLRGMSAAALMQDPNMQNIMSGLMSGGLAQGGTGGGLDALLQAGQQLASQMQAANPELVDQLRRHMNSSGANSQEGPENEPQ
ncbi:small glutamine-rich tetratricopeptide repeat-containing protein beta-like isoform X2 [Ornithodoros turicata]|uniref:small glutamine-rich tetratricopeptide repeat-containing protein beta-like isoform X2 n=1 Tax=Ornithodoros turicata TaxID=34597 RepID=UPI0031388BFB